MSDHALVRAIMKQLEYFSDIPLEYGRHYENDLERRARGLISLIDNLRAKKAVAMIEPKS